MLLAFRGVGITILSGHLIQRFFSSEIMESLKAKFVINVVGALAGIGVALITIPLYVSRIGEDRYGILSLVWIMLGYLGFLDFGLTRASANALAKLSNAPDSERSRVFVTALWINVLLGCLGGAFIYFIGGQIVLSTHDISPSLKAEVQSIMIWVAPVLPLSLAAGVCIGALEAQERFLLANVLQISSGSLGQIIPLFAALFISPSLTTVVPSVLMVRVVTALIIFATVLVVEKLHTSMHFDRQKAKDLLGYGAWVTVTNLVAPLMTTIDQFVIGNMIGASSVARYSVPMMMASRLQIFNSALARTVFPRFSRESRNEASALAARSIVSLAYLSAMLVAPALVVVHPFIDIWIGKSFSVYASPVASLLFVGAWVNGLAFIPFSLLQAQGRPDTTAKLHTLEVLPYLGALWLFVRQIGLTGAALAWSLRVIVDALIVMCLARLPSRELIRAAPALIGILAGLGLGHISTGLPVLAALGMAGTLSVGIAVVGFAIDPDIRRITRGIRSSLRANRLA
jgi:O-antigen/teichoic acid export membrane protein